jgi:hypothetical protein
MLDELPSHLLTEWLAFAQLEPFGFSTDLFGHAMVASMIANVNRKKGSKPFKPSDFMPRDEVEPEPEENKGSKFFADLKSYMRRSKAKRGNDKRSTRKAGA